MSGEPGIGKTHLVDWLSVTARARGLQVLWGRCWEGGGAPAYWPWVQILRALAGEAEPSVLARELGRGAGYVAQLVPELLERLPDMPAMPTASAIESSDARFALFDATTAFLRAAAAEQPLVIVLDDLHAADLPSLHLLHFLARDLRSAPMLIVGSHREAEVRRSPELSLVFGNLARESTGILLRGLSEPEVDDFVAAITGERAPDGVVGTLHRATAGNPLFLDELIRLLQAHDRLRDAVEPLELTIPLRLHEAIERRLAALGTETVSALRVAAVIGQEFDLGVVQHVTGASSREVGERLRAAVDEAIIAPLRATSGRLRFVHPLIREVLYDDVPGPERACLHVQAGEAIEVQHAARLDPHLPALAHHFYAAAEYGDEVRAIAYARRAAARAMALLAWEDAIVHLDHALELLESHGKASDEERCEVLLTLGEALRKAGAEERGAEILERAAELGRRLRAPVLLARAALAFGAPVTAGLVDEGRIELFEHALADLPRDDSALRARLLARLAWELYWKSGTEARRRVLCDEALGMARRLDDPATLAFVLSRRCFALWGPDDLADRLASANEMVELAARAGDLELEAQGRHWRLIALLELGDIGGVDREIAAVERIVEQRPQPEHRWWLALWAVMRALLDGRLAEVETLIGDAFTIGERYSRENASSAMQGQMFALLVDRGQLEHLAGSLEGWKASQPYYATHFPALVCGLSMIFCQLSRREETRREFEQLAQTSFATLPRYVGWLDGMYSLAQACAFLEDRERAERLYDLLRPYRGVNVVTGPALFCHGPVARALALLAATMERWEDAELHFEEALALCSRLGAMPVTARTRSEYAAMLAERDRPGDRERALRLAEEARASAQRMGMERVAIRAAELCAKLARPVTPLAPETGATADASCERNAFRRDGDGWAIEYGGRSFHLRDHRGLRFIAKLLARPGTEMSALELIGDGEVVSDEVNALAELSRHASSDAGVMLDAFAQARYRQHRHDLKNELAEAESHHDLGRVERLRGEIEFLERELSRAIGLRGRSRRAGSSTERARINVRRAVSECLRRIGQHHPELERHLGETLRTGTFCVYRPDSRVPIRWET